MDFRKSIIHRRLESVHDSPTSSPLSIIHRRLESVHDSPTSSSPLRKKSIAKTPPASTFSENDDEAERIARRREIIMSSSPPTTNGKRHSLGLGFLANIPAAQMAESISKCIKLSAENKINVKNAFSLEMIDFMTYMVKKQDVNMSDLQVASTSLDVSTKIYGYRVDSVHMEILKMVGGLDKQVVDNTEQNKEQEEAVQEDMEANVKMPKKKKKKRAKQKILSTVEALRGNIEVEKPILSMRAMDEEDPQTSDMLYQATLPIHANSGFFLHPYNDVLVDVLEDKSESQIRSNAKYSIPAIEDFSNLKICASYSNFEFLGWSVEDEPEEMPEEEADPNDENDNQFRFDLDASMEHNDEPAPDPINYFDIEHDDGNENIQACYRKTTNLDVNIVNVLDSVRLSEYSFVQPSTSLHWAGPSHWKFRNFARASVATKGDTKVVACKQAKLRRKKEFELLYDESIRDIIDAKFASSQSIKLHAKTAKAEWSAESLMLPEDMHYDIAQASKLYLHQRISIRSADSGEKENEDGVTAADVFDGDRYDYNNPNDTLEYCPNVEHDDDYNDYGNRDDGNDDCNLDDNAVLGSQGLIGDNLVAAPKLINKIPIAYCLKAKKIDMRQLKRSIWSCLKSTSDNAIGEPDEAETMKESKKFSDVYKALPRLLTKSNAEALSVPISFISMLHLANEKGLKIHSVPDMSNIIIEPGESPLT